MRTAAIWAMIGVSIYALVGATVMIIGATWLADLHQRKGWGKAPARESKTWRSLGVMALAAIPFMLTAAAVLHHKG